MERSIQDSIADLFDYCGNKNNKSYGNYSPNNIRRLIIAPDGVIVEYHLQSLVQKTNGKKFRYVTFDYMQLRQEQMVRGYKPIINLLYKRMCSSLEELVFLAQSFRYPVQNFIQIESNIQSLGSLVRLHYVTVINMTLAQFMQGYEYVLKYEFLSDLPVIQSCTLSRRLVVDKYWQNWGSAKSKATYPVEMSKLAAHFQKIKLQKEAEEAAKSKGVEDNKDSAEKLAELNKLILFYSKLYTLNNVFNSLLKEDKSSLVQLNKPFAFEQLYRVKGININDSFLKDADVSEEEALQHNIDYIEGLRVEFMKSYFASLIDAMKALIRSHKIIAKSVMNHESVSLMRGKFQASILSQITDCTGFQFNERDIGYSETLSGVIAVYCRLFLVDVDNKYKTDSYWRSLL